jgi:hypothetical protein
MSAYEVSRAHIDVLIAGAYQQAPRSDDRFSWRHDDRWHHISLGEATRIGGVLTRMNHAAVTGGTGFTGMPYRLDDLMGTSCWKEPRALSLVAVLKAIDGYEHNSDRCAGWAGSEAEAFCRSLRLWIIRLLPGYDAAPWRITDPAQAAVRAAEGAR